MSKKKKKIFCDPNVCDHCTYILEGDFMCDITNEIVLEDWVPTDEFMGEGCIHAD